MPPLTGIGTGEAHIYGEKNGSTINAGPENEEPIRSKSD